MLYFKTGVWLAFMNGLGILGDKHGGIASAKAGNHLDETLFAGGNVFRRNLYLPRHTNLGESAGTQNAMVVNGCHRKNGL